MKRKSADNQHKKKYNSIIEDPHYDPPDQYYQAPARDEKGQMSYENRQAMYHVLFHDCNIIHPSSINHNKLSSLFEINFDDDQPDTSSSSTDNSQSSSRVVSRLKTQIDANGVYENNEIINQSNNSDNSNQDLLGAASISLANNWK